MVHFSLCAAPGTLLFRTHAEARALWLRITRRVNCTALTLMPQHVHLETASEDALENVRCGARAYALWRNYVRGEAGPVWAEISWTIIRTIEHARRTRRYIHLNPCRDGLVADPMAYAWSTHRDALGLAIPLFCRVAPDPATFHEFVSSDPSVRVDGTSLPAPRGLDPHARPSLAAVFAAVSALTRTTAAGLRERSPARSLLVRSARALTAATSAEIGDLARIDATTVRHASRRIDARIALVLRVADDPRFALLEDGDLRATPGFRKYRRLR